MRSYTTIEQSKYLLELGLSRETADMEYTHEMSKVPVFWKTLSIDCVPCWSFVGLLSLIKPYKEHTYELKGTLDGGAMISFEAVTCVMYQEEEPIDAVYEMVCWLIEKKYI